MVSTSHQTDDVPVRVVASKSSHGKSHHAPTTHKAQSQPHDEKRTSKNNRHRNHNHNHNNNKQKSDHHHHCHSLSLQQQQQQQRHRTRGLFQKAKSLERAGQWREASLLLSHILTQDPTDAHSHLALARLEARREHTSVLLWDHHNHHHHHDDVPTRHSSSSSSSTSHHHHHSDEPNRRRMPLPHSPARRAFQTGTAHCPRSVHLWQAWAKYEAEAWGNTTRAQELFETALTLDAYNPYVCHAYGLMEKKQGHVEEAKELWERALTRRSTAALVCSLGELFTAEEQYVEARALYEDHVSSRLREERERTEVYLAWAWLEEWHFHNVERAEELIELALVHSPGNSRAQVAMARLEGRHKKGKDAAVRRLATACLNIDNAKERPKDGRSFNAWAHLEVKSRHYDKARKILRQGMNQFPKDQSLFQAAGNVEERSGNYTGARSLYSMSLGIEPSAPTLVAYAMLDLRHPETRPVNYTRIERFFEEALLLDPRHGPAYNAYGNMELRRGRLDEARKVYERGVSEQCSDAASVFHGLAKLELSQGNVDLAREILVKGLRQVEVQQSSMDSSKSDRSVFLAHTLGMLELNSNRAPEAMSVFQDGIARHGNSSQLLLGAALCEVKLGKDESARQRFKQSVEADGRHAQAWQAWGVMEMRAGNFAKARQLLEDGLKGAPTHGALWQAYANMAGRLGNIEKARILYQAGIRKCPRHVPLYQGWASLEVREGNLVLAKRLISEALTLDKRSAPGWLVASEIEQQQGNDGLVGLVLRRGIECVPNEAELYRALGNHLVGKGQINDAREILEKGLEVNPLHAPLYHSLAELEARVFNLKGLAVLNERAAQLFQKDALASTLSSSQAFGRKIQMRQSPEPPRGVRALSEQVGESGFDDTRAVDQVLDLSSTLQLEDEAVNDILNCESFPGRNETGDRMDEE